MKLDSPNFRKYFEHYFPRLRPTSRGQTVAQSPFREDRNPSFSIDVQRGLWYDFGTGEGGGIVDFEQRKNGGTREEAGKRVCEIVGVKADGSLPGPEALYNYTDEKGSLLYQVVRLPGKKFVQRRPGGKGEWVWNLNGVRRVLYNLPEVLKAPSVLIVEGERDCETARELRLTATCNSGGAGKWRPECSEFLRGKRVCVICDADPPGVRHGRDVAASLLDVVESVCLVEALPAAKDLTEFVEKGGTREALLAFIKATPKLTPTDGARLSSSAQAVDGELAAVDIAATLDGLVAFIRRFVFLRESQARVVALWVAHTHALQAADTTPYLAVTSAEKRSGKSRLLEVLDVLVANPWMTGRVTAAILMRKVDAKQPTLLLDESDAAFGSGKEYAEALRGMLNSGHRRGGRASCCIGQGANISFRDFSTFCAKAIAGIGKLPDTVGDRTILIRLKRALPGEVEKFRLREVGGEAARLRRSLEAWCKANMAQLRDTRPELPEQLSDRQQDGAEPLLAIADAAGGAWPQAARSALVELCGESQAADDSTGVRLLGDVRTIFDERAADRIASAELVGGLAQIETSPWGEWKHGKPLTARGLAHLLRRFGISPRTIRLDPGETSKGYLREQFEDAWKRYVPPSPRPVSVTASQAAKTLGETHFSHPSQPPLVTAVQNSREPHEHCAVTAVTDRKAGDGRKGGLEVLRGEV